MGGASSGRGLAAIERCADAWAELHARIGSPLRPRRSPRTGRALPGGPAGARRAQERLAARGGDRRDRAPGRAAPAECRHLGHRRRPRRPPGLRRRAPRRRGDWRPHRGRDRLSEEGEEVLRRRAPIHRHGGSHRELPSRRLPGLRRRRMVPPSSTAPCICRGNGSMTGGAGPRRVFRRTPASRPRSSWRSGCWRGHSTRMFPPAGSWPMPSTVGRTSCGGGSKSAGVPTR